MKRITLGVSFVGTLIVLIGGLVAATMAAMIIMNLFNTLSTQPYITVSGAYFVNTTSFTHFHVLFYNIGRSSVTFKCMYIYLPGNLTLMVQDNGVVIRLDNKNQVGEAEFNPQTLIIEPYGGTLDVLVKVNLELDNLGDRVLGIAVFNRDVVIVLFEKA